MRLLLLCLIPLLVGLAGYVATHPIAEQQIFGPGCHDDNVSAALAKLIATPGEEAGLTFLDAHRTRGSRFSMSRDCTADVTEMRGMTAASDETWRRVDYHIATDRSTGDLTVTAHERGPITPVFKPVQ